MNIKKKYKNILVTTSLFFLLGCTTTLSLNIDQQVQIITLKQTEDYNCKEVAPINAFGKKSMTAGADRRNAITEFKNKIVEKGGNAGLISNQLNSKAGFEISGYALDCENLE
tara:strand:- start:670 stop:1005 length:336 start_codon:yes stop_codon:yes gene_type:complete